MGKISNRQTESDTQRRLSPLVKRTKTSESSGVILGIREKFVRK